MHFEVRWPLCELSHCPLREKILFSTHWARNSSVVKVNLLLGWCCVALTTKKSQHKANQDLSLCLTWVEAKFRRLSWLNYSCHSLTYVNALPAVRVHIHTRPNLKFPLLNSHNSHTFTEIGVCGEVVSLLIYLHYRGWWLREKRDGCAPQACVWASAQKNIYAYDCIVYVLLPLSV